MIGPLASLSHIALWFVRIPLSLRHPLAPICPLNSRETCRLLPRRSSFFPLRFMLSPGPEYSPAHKTYSFQDEKLSSRISGLPNKPVDELKEKRKQHALHHCTKSGRVGLGSWWSGNHLSGAGARRFLPANL